MHQQYARCVFYCYHYLKEREDTRLKKRKVHVKRNGKGNEKKQRRGDKP